MASNDCWIYQMASRLTCEILEVMAGVKLTKWPTGDSSTKMDTVYGLVSGKDDIQIQFEADPKLFARMARNMIGGEPEDEFEVQEYAAEIFNVLCGRIVSELCDASKTVLHFRPIEYKAYSDEEPMEYSHALDTLYFKSDNDEFARLSWSRESVESLIGGE